MIGVFDSGIGGLSVWKELIKVVPCENTLYVADSGNCPYGPQSKASIISRSDAITKYLISKGAKLIVVACNTATAAAINYLRENYHIPFVGIEPAIKPAIINSKTGVIGVLATKGTFNGELYNNTLKKYSKNTIVLEQIGEGLVEIVEHNQINSQESITILKQYLQPMLEKNVDNIVLGCTHYPFLEPVIKQIVGEKVTIINPAPAVAKRVYEILQKENLFCKNEGLNSSFITTGDNLFIMQQFVKNISPDNYEHYNFYKEKI
jgi:glutamate racemase